MKSLTLSFEVHQPHRLREDGVKEDADTLHERYFDNELNKRFFEDVTENCYLPATRRLLEAARDLEEQGERPRVNFSVSSSWIEQAKKYRPELLELLNSFPEDTIEFIGQTHYHSMAVFLEEKEEFRRQLRTHREIIQEEFGQKPTVMTNTELIYNNSIGRIASEEGFEGVFTEGTQRILGWRSPNHIYTQPDFETEEGTAVLLRNRRLTDDVGYRFSRKDWEEYPLTAEKYTSWLSAEDGDVVNLFMDYETFGEHHWKGTGILDFLEELPRKIAGQKDLRFMSASEAVRNHPPVGEFDAFRYNTVSWADREMDETAWLGNRMQKEIFKKLQDTGGKVKRLDEEEVTEVWRKLLTSDHLHHIATKKDTDESVHSYFSYFDSPQQGFKVIMEHIRDFDSQVSEKLRK